MNLNDKVSVNLWSVIAAIPTVIGFVVWLSTVANVGNANAEAIKEIKSDLKDLPKDISKIKEDVSYIKATIKKER